MTGYVYMIENENGKVKIGKSTNPQRRVMNIRSQSGYNIVNSHFSPPLYQYSELESYLHDTFKESRGIGEWFDTSYKAVVSYFESLDLSRWNVEPTKEEKEMTSDFVKGMVDELDKCLQNCINGLRPADIGKINEILDDMDHASDKIDKRSVALEKYIDNLRDQIDVLQSKLIYIEEQGFKIKFPDLPQYNEDEVILAREDIIEEYKSIK